MATYYHGSITSGITALEPRSLLHGSGERVVYLTDSLPYALFYIWDEAHNHAREKYVTGGIRDGIAFYEEQFPHQLEAFYRGVSGYVYHMDTARAHILPNRPRLFYASEAVAVTGQTFIPDVYDALLANESAGELRILRYTEQSLSRQNELTDMIAAYIRQQQFFMQNEEQRAFMQRYFAAAWALAEH